MSIVPSADPNMTNNPIAQKYTKNAAKVAEDLSEAKKNAKDAGAMLKDKGIAAGEKLDLDKVMFDMYVKNCKRALEKLGIIKPPAVSSTR